MTGSQSILTPLTFAPEIQPVEARIEFVERVQEIMRFVQNDPFVETLNLQQEALQVFYTVFFEYINDWAQREQKKNENIASDPNADRLRETATGVRKELEQNIINFACCYMSLAHSKGIVAAKSKKYKPKLASGSQTIEWTKSTTHMLSQNLIERQELLDSTKNLALGLHFLQQFEAKHGVLSELVDGIYGQKAGDKILKSLRSALRNGEFEKAKKLIAGLIKPKGLFSSQKKGLSFEGLISTMEAYVDLLQEHAAHLHIDPDPDSNKMFLSEAELKVVLVAQMKELEKIEQFLNKYFVSYIAYTIKKFTMLQDKLAIVGSLESLITLYIQMLSGIVQPLRDMKDVRKYESSVVEKVKFLLNSQFREIENLQHFNNEDLRVFNENLSVFKDVLEKV